MSPAMASVLAMVALLFAVVAGRSAVARISRGAGAKERVRTRPLSSEELRSRSYRRLNEPMLVALAYEASLDLDDYLLRLERLGFKLVSSRSESELHLSSAVSNSTVVLVKGGKASQISVILRTTDEASCLVDQGELRWSVVEFGKSSLSIAQEAGLTNLLDGPISGDDARRHLGVLAALSQQRNGLADELLLAWLLLGASPEGSVRLKLLDALSNVYAIVTGQPQILVVEREDVPLLVQHDPDWYRSPPYDSIGNVRVPAVLQALQESETGTSLIAYEDARHLGLVLRLMPEDGRAPLQLPRLDILSVPLEPGWVRMVRLARQLGNPDRVASPEVQLVLSRRDALMHRIETYATDGWRSSNQALLEESLVERIREHLQPLPFVIPLFEPDPRGDRNLTAVELEELVTSLSADSDSDLVSGRPPEPLQSDLAVVAQAYRASTGATDFLSNLLKAGFVVESEDPVVGVRLKGPSSHVIFDVRPSYGADTVFGITVLEGGEITSLVNEALPTAALESIE